MTAVLLAGLTGTLAAAELRVTGQVRSCNGTTEVPIGLFGVHATKLTPEQIADWGVECDRTITHSPTGQPRDPAPYRMVVETFYDRYQPALVLTEPNWRATLEQIARRYGAAATGPRHVEFWNEPFLNWATRPGVNYDARFYETTNRVEGAPMTIKGWDRPLDSLVWSKQLRLVEPHSGAVHYLANGDPALQHAGVKEGGMYSFRGKEYRMDSVWWGRDPNQPAYWSGQQNSQFYRWMLVPFARALKETNPAVQIIAGWGFHIRSGDWRAWDILFKPMIDEAIPWMDAIGEHHYGGETRHVAADYEITYAYALAKHGKRLQFYNTEAGGELDPQRPDTPAQSKWNSQTPDGIRGNFTYLVRDIVHLLDKCPDKAVARAQHEALASPGPSLAFRFLKELRGQLLVVKPPAPGVWTVASRQGARLCVVAFNNRAEPVRFSLALGLPAEKGRCVALGEQAGQLALHESPATNQVYHLPGKAALKWVFQVPADQVGRVRNETQFVAERILERETGGVTITVPAAARQRARQAWLRVAYDGVAVTGTFNGQPIALDGEPPGIVDVPVDVTTLREVNQVVLDSPAKKIVAGVSLILADAD
jgi:hypothetical protein